MGEGRKERVCRQRVTWKFTLPYVSYIANGNFLYGSENSNRGSETIYRVGWGENGKEFWERGGMGVPVADSC